MNAHEFGETTDLGSSCREIRRSEIDHMKVHGWVKLDKLITAGAAKYLLRRAKETMGEEGDARAAPKGAGVRFFVPGGFDGFADEEIRPLVKAMGRAARALMDRGDDTQVRYSRSGVLAKLPVSKAASLSGASKTDFHQDLPEWCVDRTGGMTIWIALEEYGPEAGTMCFLDGSHRMGPLGGIKTRPGDVTDVYPKLLQECPPTPQIHYKAGDATAHFDLCVHGASTNNSDKPRFSFTAIFLPADACWTGSPFDMRDEATAAMTKFQQLDDRWFPIVSE